MQFIKLLKELINEKITIDIKDVSVSPENTRLQDVRASKNLSKKLAPKIRINTIAPGNIFIKDGTWDLKMKINPETTNQMLKEKVPLQRFGLPEEISDLVLFISSNRASFITGSCIVIDGGQTNSY